ncbi:MAG: type II toxin-antitoxin system RelE/ParE family toxin [Xanthomonadales bacterium]|nr:type II toxin-antitoxin system RelE/ParE family toxin [Xanthomonadales bacterium]
MIRSFSDKEAESIWGGTPSRKLPGSIQQVARRKLRMLNAAAVLEDLRIPPANRLEALKGDRKGQHSIRINDQWRICFQWKNGDAHDVEIVDYH